MTRLPGNRDVWRIAGPMILSNVSVPLLGMVDTGVTGHLNDTVYLGAVAIGAVVFGFLYTGVMTDLPDVRATALVYLPWMVLSPLVSVWSFLYDGVFVGATRAREMRDIMLASAILVFLPAWYLLQPLGNHGLWLAFMLFMAARGAGMYFVYERRVVSDAVA